MWRNKKVYTTILNSIGKLNIKCMMRTILITGRWCIVDPKFNFKKSTPAIYFTKKQAKQAKDVYYPDREDVKIHRVKILIS